MAIKVKFKDKNDDFYKKIVELSGEQVALCDQCGTCSGGCPFIEEMDINPSEIMRKVMLGQKEVMDSRTMWICASCFACTVRCPRGLDLSKVAEALRQVKLRQAVDHIDIKDISNGEIKIYKSYRSESIGIYKISNDGKSVYNKILVSESSNKEDVTHFIYDDISDFLSNHENNTYL